MSFQIIENPNPSIAGRLGKGFAQGLSETVPKEIERQRMSSGLAQLKEQAQSGASPLDLLTKAYTTPGLTPEMAQSIQPYLLQAAQLGASTGGKRGAKGIVANAQNGMQGEGGGGRQGQEEQKAFEHKQYRRLGTPEALAERSLELQRQNPFLYPTADAAGKEAREEYQRQQNSLQKIDAKWNKILGNKLQSDGTYAYNQVLGQLQDEFKTKAEEAVLEGKMSEEEALEKYGKEALDFAKVKTNFDSVGFRSMIPLIGDKKALETNLSAIKKKYKELGKLEEFNNELISKFDLTDQNASSFTFPVDKPVSKYLSSVKAKFYPGSKYAQGRTNAISDKEVVKQIADHISNDDSLFSIIKELEKKNYVASDLLKEFNDAYQSGQIRLNGRQQKELEKNPSPRPSLGDLFFFKNLGKTVLGE
jgi:hypothetical protein